MDHEPSLPGTTRTPKSLPFIIAALSMMGPFCIDTYLPSFREMEISLQCTELQVQQSLTAFLFPFAFMSLWHGSFSDALGRRKVIIWSLFFLAGSSLGCALSPNIGWLWFFRVLQGLSAGVFVVGRAVVRDVYQGPAAQRVMSQVSVLFAIAPAVAPVLGGLLHAWFGWRSVFYFLALFAAGVASWAASLLPETHPVANRNPLHAARLTTAYLQTVQHPGFMSAALAGAIGFAAVFLYVASAPVFLPKYLHVKETQFIWLFGPLTFGLMCGGWLSGKAAGRLSFRQTLGCSFGLMFAATVANLLFHTLRPAALPWSVIPLFFYATGIALALPTLTLLGLDYFPGHRGLAASLQAFLLTAANACTAGLLVPLTQGRPLPLALASLGLLLGSTACLPFLQRGRPVESLPSPPATAVA